MEPRFFKRGNNLRQSKRKKTGESFNGATLFQTWKYVQVSNEAFSAKRFNGATLFQTWKFGRTADNLSLENSFNGATLFQTWKCGELCCAFAVRQFASMEPRFFKRGNASFTIPALTAGALQWSHAFSNVEIYFLYLKPA